MFSKFSHHPTTGMALSLCSYYTYYNTRNVVIKIIAIENAKGRKRIARRRVGILPTYDVGVV